MTGQFEIFDRLPGDGSDKVDAVVVGSDKVDAVVVGGGPSGATAADDLARRGLSVVLLDRAGRIKPCGGAIPPRCIADFAIPPELLVARIRSARMVSPKRRDVDMPIDGGFVGMVDREHFDEWLRERAAGSGARRLSGTFEEIARDPDGTAVVRYLPKGAPAGAFAEIRARSVIGADGARSAIAKAEVKGGAKVKCVFAYHEIVRSPAAAADDSFDPARCDVHYRGVVSPDFYGWIFPHGDTTSVGTGSARKGFALRGAVEKLRADVGLGGAETLRREGAPIPMKPLKRWDNGRDLVLAGDAAGVVAPASGEGIYYAMLGGRLAADAVAEFLETGRAAALAGARRRFMKEHGRVFLILGVMQAVWYRSDAMRERFVKLCRDPDVQRLTWDSYMNKRLKRSDPMAHLRVFFKDMAHLLRLATP